MRKKKTFMGMAIVIAILILGVGYAAIDGVELFITGNANVSANADFSVEFDTAHEIVLSSDAQVDWPNSEGTGNEKKDVVTGAYTNATNATMTVYLDSTHRNANAIYKIQNKSDELQATVDAVVSGLSTANEEFINVTTTFCTNETCSDVMEDNHKIAPGNVIYLKVDASLKKLPANDISDATFNVTINAEPADSGNLN